MPDRAADPGRGFNLTVEFLAAILTWGGIGWLLDRWLGTGPWLMVAGFVVGNACGIYLVWLHSRSDEELQRARESDDRRGRGG